MQKEIKLNLMEFFLSLDQIFFHKHLSKVKINEDCHVCRDTMITDYETSKAAILSSLLEISNLIKYSPKKINSKVDKKSLNESIKRRSKKALYEAKILLSDKRTKYDIKSKFTRNLQEGIKVNSENLIRKRALSFAVDSLLIKNILEESLIPDNLNTWTGKIIEDSYKILRNSLIESGMNIQDKMM